MISSLRHSDHYRFGLYALRQMGTGSVSILITLLGLLLFTFALSHFSPIDPVLQLAGDHASASTYQQIRHQLGVDRSLPVQFLYYLNQLLHGNLGVSHLTGQPVFQDLARTFPATFELATASIFIGVFGGISLAFLSTWKPGSWIDNTVRIISLLGYSVPIFWLGLLGLLLFYATLHWSAGPGRLDDIWIYTMEPGSGLMLLDTWRSGDWDMFRNAIAHLWLPSVILGLLSMASITRLLRAAILEESNKEYVMLARATGATRWQILRHHIVPNIRGTMVTVIVLAYTNLLEGSVLTETVFSWPGVGRYLTNALFSADTPAILGATLLIGMCFILMNAFADSLTYLLNPRTR